MYHVLHIIHILNIYFSQFLPSAPIFSYEVVDSHIVKQYATIRNQRTSISDHFGVSTTFQLVDANQ